MKRPLLVWLVFAICTALALAVLGWFSLEMVRLDRDAAHAREIAAREENVRLALWRMDSALASMHGMESARSVDEYSAFVQAPTSFTIDLRQNVGSSLLVPSALLGFTPPFVRLHLELHRDGRITSPQVPEGAELQAALGTGITRSTIDTSAERLRTFLERGMDRGLLTMLQGSVKTEMAKEKGRGDLDTAAAVDAATTGAVQALVTQAPAAPPPSSEAAPTLTPLAERQNTVELKKSQAEQQQRAGLADDNYLAYNRPAPQRARPRDGDPTASNPPSGVGSSFDGAVAEGWVGGETSRSAGAAPRDEAAAFKRQVAEAPPGEQPSDEIATAAQAQPPGSAHDARRSIDFEATPLATGTLGSDDEADSAEFVQTNDSGDAFSTGPSAGPLQVAWIGDELFFLRRVDAAGDVRAQAVWLDWPELRAWLLSRVTDLLPNAGLVPVAAGTPYTLDDASRRLAFLPVRLQPGSATVLPSASWSPLHSSLTIAWTLAGVGVLALTTLLAGTLRLSERRAAFVSAVTHELRTPLTTFRMYTEMLSSGMVPDETKRRSYVDTLRKEAERLSHLVENVLSYARLERGRASRRIEETTPGDLFARIEERLRSRAEQGGLALEIRFETGAADIPLRTDTTAFEQIVFNLVDNAAKYARRTDGGSLTISVAAGERGRVIVRVVDQGSGIPDEMRRRLFRPFSKSAAEAAHSQPGVGLGLALSRRLARDELHGELALEKTGPDGTVFRLEV